MEPSASELGDALAALARRVDALERAIAAAPPAVLPAPAVRASAAASWRADWGVVPPLVGRTCVALAGAYLLRALTDAGALSPAVGVTAGLAYAALWFAGADLVTAGARASATFHGLVGALVAFPIVWEAATRFQLLTPPAAALMLAAVSGVGLGVAAHRRLQIVAWAVAMSGAAAAVALVPATDRVVPSALVLIALAVAALWLGYTHEWHGLRWPIAAVADVAVVGLTVRVATGHGVEGAATALAIQILLVGGFLVSIIVRTLVRGRDVIPFEIVQGAVALAVGLGGAVAVAHAATAGTIAVGVAALLLGGSCYVLAFFFVVRRQGMRANFYFYTTLALMLVLAGARLLFPDPMLTVALAALAIGAAFAALIGSPRLVVTHAVVYGAAAAVSSGLLAASACRVVAPAGDWPPFAWPMLVATVALAACEAMPLPRKDGFWDFWSRPPRFVLLALATWGGAGWIIELIVRVVSAGPAAMEPGTLATVRTGVIAIAAVGLARIGRARPFSEARWAVYPLLLAGGVKLLMEDLPRSRPATLFVAFAAYGVALIVAPRLYVQRPPADRPPLRDPL